MNSVEDIFRNMTHHPTGSASSSVGSEGEEAKASEDRLMVAVRVRPLNKGETQRVIHVINDKAVALEEASRDGPRKRAPERIYTYDRAFGEEATQDEVYQATTAALVRDVLSGYNGAVFAYGATGAGKTHTMTGGGPRDPGLMERALTGLFAALNSKPNKDDYTVNMSYLEIYNENIRDLLSPSAGAGLELREDAGGRAAVAGLSAVRVRSASEALPLLQRGARARVVESTAANKTSSRSHALLSVTVTSCGSGPGDSSQAAVSGRLFLVDLAGSERAHVARSRGRRLQEGAHINRSLLALANCITALSGGARYVNYRDSKLTRLLKEALSGNCRTVMVAHVSPAVENREESRNTLLYADRANHITNKVKRNVLDSDYHVTQYRTVINELKNEISRLRTKMKEDRPRSGLAAEVQQQSNNNNNFSNAQKNNEMKALRHAIVGTFQEQMRLRKKLMELDSHLLGLAMDSERQHLVISHWESRNNRLYNVPTTSRLSTQQSFRRSTGSNSEEGTVAVEQAWSELASIEQEQERVRAERTAAEVELETVRKKGAALEDELPSRTSSEEERELLALACRVHELQADKLALQSERASRAADLRRRDLQLLRYDRQRQLSDEIITRQRQIMDEGGLKLPPDLLELYTLYQQEIHASTYTDSAMVFNSYTLPPISNNMVETVQWSSGSSGSGRGSSSGGDSEWLPASPARRLLGAPVRLPRLPSTPASQGSGRAVKRSSSEDSITASPLDMHEMDHAVNIDDNIISANDLDEAIDVK